MHQHSMEISVKTAKRKTKNKINIELERYMLPPGSFGSGVFMYCMHRQNGKEGQKNKNST